MNQKTADVGFTLGTVGRNDLFIQPATNGEGFGDAVAVVTTAFTVVGKAGDGVIAGMGNTAGFVKGCVGDGIPARWIILLLAL